MCYVHTQAASTVEPRVTIPAQDEDDLTGLDLLLRNSRFGDNDNDNGNDTSGSMFNFNFPSSSSRHKQQQQRDCQQQQQQLQQVVVRRSGKALGDAPPSAAAAAAAATVATAAAAFSAFTSPESESSPAASAAAAAIRAAEDNLASADAVAPPARPQDHPATDTPALSRLLVPPSFQNEALRGDFIASLEQHLAEYADGSGGGVGSGGGSGRAGDDGDSSSSVVKGGERAGLGRDRRDAMEACGGGGGNTSAAAAAGGRGADDNGSSSLTETETTAVGGRPVDGSEGGTTKSSNWAQEYHDYLCGKKS